MAETTGGMASSVGSYLSSVQQVIGAVQGVVSQLQSFVAPLDPSLIKIYELTIKDLNATIGKGLVPVFVAVMDAARLFADTLTPIMAEFRPVMDRLASLVSRYAETAASQFASAYEALSPLLDVILGVTEVIGGIFFAGMNAVAALLKILSPIIATVALVLNAILTPFQLLSSLIETFSKVLATLASGFAQLFNFGDTFGDMKEGMKDITEGLKKFIGIVAKTAIMLAAWVAKMLGMTSFIDGMIKKLGQGKKTEDSVGAGVQGQASITSFSEFSKSVSIAAFAASMNGKQRETELDVLQGLRQDLEKLKMEPTSLKDIIVSALQEAGKSTASVPVNAAAYGYKKATGLLDWGLDGIVSLFV